MTSTTGNWFGDPEDSDVTGEFEPDPAPEPGEPDGLGEADEPTGAVLEADPVDVALQREPVPGDEEGYERAE